MKYTKNQIVEALAYWNKKLDNINESVGSTGMSSAARFAMGQKLPNEEQKKSQVVFGKDGAIYLVPQNDVDKLIDELKDKPDKDKDVKPVALFTGEDIKNIMTSEKLEDRRKIFDEKQPEQTNESIVSTKYTKKQIFEAISYWQKQLNKQLNENLPNGLPDYKGMAREMVSDDVANNYKHNAGLLRNLLNELAYDDEIDSYYSTKAKNLRDFLDDPDEYENRPAAK